MLRVIGSLGIILTNFKKRGDILLMVKWMIMNLKGTIIEKHLIQKTANYNGFLIFSISFKYQKTISVVTP